MFTFPFIRFLFIHESIKTRVETQEFYGFSQLEPESLSMNPLKQGLKQLCCEFGDFLSQLSLSMNPLKQGLKQYISKFPDVEDMVFIHESIKTRVETRA